ncbi:uncharacterized protein LOC124285376 [Haliotis rubra]|uniref:uncharacterized protein LOC124285376 n=1 Tax=Haliotis rubra TaxID=36100 RepID=UPI001EE5BD9A|nr:uncharacterized protein LOC124285376 [Haliotis rubra]
MILAVKMWSYYCKCVFLIFGIMKLVSGDSCLDVDSVVQRDKYMEHQVFRKFWSQSLYTCASECLMSSACLSFGFEKKTRTCLLYSDSSDSDTANVVNRRGFLFSDIQHWPKSLSGRCAQITCHNNTGCEVTRLGLARCAPEFQGCGHPPDVRGANTTYDGHYLGAVATYSCDPDFRTCYNKVISTCQSSGAWESLAGLCGQYRWHDPIQDKYSFPCGPPSKFQLTIKGKATAATRWAIQILKQADLIFFLEFRLDYNGQSNVAVINTRKDGNWGSPLHFDLTLAVGKTMDIQITLLHGVFRLVIDGVSIHNFTERDPGEKPDKFAIVIDVSVSMIELMGL